MKTMTREEVIERRIRLKRQHIELIEKDIELLEEELKRNKEKDD
jgi:hypothetical protein